MQIRKARQTDAETIAEFNQSMAMETEGKELHSDIIQSGVKRLFEKPEFGFYIVAEKEGVICGSLMITYEWSDWRDGLVWWIQSVYIPEECRRQGIYRKMYDFIQKEAGKDKDVKGVRLYVEKENFKAQQTYRNLGMNETGYIMFEAMQ
jgi:ribosomal protein S18 acetylase RimI-like enzyme